MIAGSKLVWNNQAWTQFFFGVGKGTNPTEHAQATLIEQSWQDIAEMNTDLMRDMEAQLLYSRVTLTFGWSVELGRLCILGVEW